MVFDTSKLGSWKTTLSGVLGAVAIAVYPLFQGQKPTTQQIIIAVFVAAMGYFAKDKNVTGGSTANPNSDPLVVASTADPKKV